MRPAHCLSQILSLGLAVQGTRAAPASSNGTTPTPEQSWTYSIPSALQNASSQARFTIPSTNQTIDKETLLLLDSPAVTNITDSAFDWWYFDVVSDTNANESIVVTFFSASHLVFPFLDPTDTVLIAYLWATFANGTIFTKYMPASIATVTGGKDATRFSEGIWAETGFSWRALDDQLTRYEVTIAAEEMHVEGKFTISANVAPHFPCGIQPGLTTLEIAPHIGWLNLIPDAVGTVDVRIEDTELKFQGSAYHDKNWSDRPFLESVQTWYWGHGRLGPYSVVWFSYIALNDPSNTTYVSGFVAREGKTLVSGCDESVLTLSPVGGTARYPPRAGDIPEGFRLEFDIGKEQRLRVNVSVQTFVGGDQKYYLRWTGNMTGDVVEVKKGGDGGSGENLVVKEDGLEGVAVFEQFAMLE